MSLCGDVYIMTVLGNAPVPLIGDRSFKLGCYPELSCFFVEVVTCYVV